METDFLNFHDEEHFSGLDSQEFEDSLIDPYNHYADDFVESNSSYWELDEDEEQVLNGDIAVIPESGNLDIENPFYFPDPDIRDDFGSDWNFAGIEEKDDDLNVVVSLSDARLTSTEHRNTRWERIHKAPSTVPVPENIFDSDRLASPQSIIPPYPFRLAEESSLAELHLNENPLDPELLLNTSFDKDLKNLDLLAAVTNDDLDLNLTLHLSPNKLPPVDFDINLKEPFDLTSYINGDQDADPELLSRDDLEKKPSTATLCPANSCHAPSSKPIFIENSNHEQIIIRKTDSLQVQVDVDDDCIDVETISPSDYHPVLEARDVTSLLEQFEANEVVNGSTHSDHTYQCSPAKSKVKRKRKGDYGATRHNKTNGPLKQKKVFTDIKNYEKKQKEVVEKIKAKEKRKGVFAPIPVIPAIPTIPKMRAVKADSQLKHKRLLGRKNKIPTKTVNASSSRESIHLDHDYCWIAPSKSSSAQSTHRTNYSCERVTNDLTAYYKVLRKQQKLANCGVGVGSKGIRCLETKEVIESTKQRVANSKKAAYSSIDKQTSEIDDTAIRIQQTSTAVAISQFKKQVSVQNKNSSTVVHSIQNNKPNKNSLSLLKTDVRMQHQLLTLNNKSLNLLKPNISQIKNSEGKLMVSVLKNNIRNVPVNPAHQINQVVETKTSSDRCVQNIIVSSPKAAVYEDSKRPKKRKLNLEEYKKRREIIQTRSCNNSRTNSPNHTSTVGGNCSPMVNHGYGSFSLPATAIGSPNSQPSTPVYEFEPKKTPPVEAKKLSPQELLLKMAADLLTTPAKSSVKEAAYNMEPFTPPGTTAAETEKEMKLKGDEPSNIHLSALQQCKDDIEMVSIVSVGVNTDITVEPEPDPKPIENKIHFHINKRYELLPKNNYFETGTSESEDIASPVKTEVTVKQRRSSAESNSSSPAQQANLDEDCRLEAIIRPFLQHASTKINSNSLISNIMATILQKNTRTLSGSSEEHGEDHSRSVSRSSNSSFSSSNCSRAQSRSPTRPRRTLSRRQAKNSDDRYSHCRRRSGSNQSYRSYRRSRSPLKWSGDRNNRPWETLEQEKIRQVEERRVIYVGRLLPGTTKMDLKRRFEMFGPIVDVSVHFREQGDNYGFVTFQYQIDAYDAIERGNENASLPQYDISFGGRRAFCQTRYSDLDSEDAIELGGIGTGFPRPAQEDSFDILLKEVQAKILKQRQV